MFNIHSKNTSTLTSYLFHLLVIASYHNPVEVIKHPLAHHKACISFAIVLGRFCGDAHFHFRRHHQHKKHIPQRKRKLERGGQIVLHRLNL